MCGATLSPASKAFLASSPAASSTPGLEVFVHEVIAAISTSPFAMRSPEGVVTAWSSRSAGWLKPFCAGGSENNEANWRLTWPSSIRSCGRFGPARLGATLPRSSVTTCE